jgi:hypothetical protein
MLSNYWALGLILAWLTYTEQYTGFVDRVLLVERVDDIKLSKSRLEGSRSSRALLSAICFCYRDVGGVGMGGRRSIR